MREGEGGDYVVSFAIEFVVRYVLYKSLTGLVRLGNSWQKQDLKFPVPFLKKEKRRLQNMPMLRL